MALTKAEKERVKLQSVARSLQHLDERDIPEYEQIESCLGDADRNLQLALQASESNA